jgi:23S rRNA (uridine2552-2'-O)-methyltransferase
MARSKSSGRWLDEHFNDQYVKKAQQDGYRSRASYKLLELQAKDKLFKPGMTVLDLGSAPGGWSQVALELVGKKGRVVASDILPMDPIGGVDFVEGDFTELEVYEQIISVLAGAKVDLVISDMAPNMSGVTAVDQPKAMYLVELSVDMAGQILSSGGCLIAKVFHGEGFDELLKTARSKFNKVQIRKPDASRSRSKEQYLVASGFKG